MQKLILYPFARYWCCTRYREWRGRWVRESYCWLHRGALCNRERRLLHPVQPHPLQPAQVDSQWRTHIVRGGGVRDVFFFFLLLAVTEYATALLTYWCRANLPFILSKHNDHSNSSIVVLSSAVLHFSTVILVCTVFVSFVTLWLVMWNCKSEFWEQYSLAK